MTAPNSTAASSRLADLGPGIAAAVSFALADVLSKVAFIAGMDLLSLSTFRSMFSVVFMIGWLWLQPPPVPYTPRQRWIALGVGVLFAGIVFGLFKAIELVNVPIAHPELFHLSAADRNHRRADRHRQARLARRRRGRGGVSAASR